MFNSKALRLLIISLMLTLPLLAVNAQDCPGGMSSEDCTLVQTAAQNTANSQSFNLDFSINANVDTGFLGAIVIDVAGSGPMVLDGAGNVIAAHLDMPSITNEIPFMGSSSGAASFILVDGVAYFGAGESLDALTWQSVDVSQLTGFDPSFSAMASTDVAASAGAMTTPDLTGWTRSDGTSSTGVNATVLSAAVTGGDLFSEAQAATEELQGSGFEGLGDLGAMFEGMAGSYDATSALYIDADQRLIEVITDANITMDMSGLMDAAGDIAATPEGDSAEGDGMTDMLTGMLGNMTSVVASRVTFSDFNASFTITAPEGAEPVSQTVLDSISYSYAIPDLISGYFTALASESMMGDFGSLMGDFGFSSGYMGNCVDNTQNPVGALSGTVTGTLAEGTADIYTFTATAGQTITLAMSSTEFDTYVELLGPDGTGLNSDDDGSGTSTDSLLTYTVESDGTYTAVACGFSSFDVGAYTLTLGN